MFVAVPRPLDAPWSPRQGGLETGRTGEAFRGFADLIEMEGIEVYGEPTDRMLEQLQQKAEALGEAGRVVVDRRQAGFTRLA